MLPLVDVVLGEFPKGGPGRRRRGDLSLDSHGRRGDALDLRLLDRVNALRNEGPALHGSRACIRQAYGLR
jgi:hypothetical protein